MSVGIPTVSLGAAPRLWWLILSIAVGCGRGESGSPSADAVREELQRDLTAPEAAAAAAPDWVRQMASASASSGRLGQGEWPIAAATLSDDSYADDRMEPIRRLVYRVSFIVPPLFRQRRAHLGAHPGELHVDVAATRVRARFVGPGWPVHEGSEVRLREDTPGVYVFDGEGGRWLGPGAMAAWFEGREGTRATSRIRVRRDYAPVPSDGPGALVCALLAEWTHQPRDALQGRCRGNAIPPGFRFGPWSADLTAVVPMEVPRHRLRADEVEPPDRPAAVPGRFMIAGPELERLQPQRPVEPVPATAPVLRVQNDTHARVILMVQGLPAAIVESGEVVPLVGLGPGFYRMGAIRPFGVLSLAPKLLEVPGELVIGVR